MALLAEWRVPEEEARRLVQSAWRERLGTIRDRYWGRTVVGVVVLSLGCFLLRSLGYWWSDGPFKPTGGGKMLTVPVLLVFFGGWRFLDGVSGMLMARWVEGSVTEVE